MLCLEVVTNYENRFSGPLSSSLYIDHDNGDINITQNIMESGLFNVMATAEIDGKIYNETATVSHCAAVGSTGA